MAYTCLTYHIVFGTKNRRPLLTPVILPRLIEYMGGTIRKLNGKSIEINGPADHIHILTSLPPTIAVCDVLREIKSVSSGWIHREFADSRDFAWQVKYSAFVVSPSVLPAAIRYVQNQQEHHRKVSFRDELVWLLEQHGIEFDERDLWE